MLSATQTVFDSKMDPDELEFIGENEPIGIIPNFTLDDAIHLISGSIGPFRAGMPVHGKQLSQSTFFFSAKKRFLSDIIYFDCFLENQCHFG